MKDEKRLKDDFFLYEIFLKNKMTKEISLEFRIYLYTLSGKLSVQNQASP